MSKNIEELKKVVDYPQIIQEIIDTHFEETLDDLLKKDYVITKVYFKTEGEKEHKYYESINVKTELSDNGYNIFTNGIVGLSPSSRGKNQADLYILLANDKAFTLVKDCYRAGVYKPAFIELYKDSTKETSFLKSK